MRTQLNIFDHSFPICYTHPQLKTQSLRPSTAPRNPNAIKNNNLNAAVASHPALLLQYPSLHLIPTKIQMLLAVNQALWLPLETRPTA